MFQVEQNGFFNISLIWEYGRALGRSRRKTVFGKLLLLPGAYVLFAGVMAVLGAVGVMYKPENPEELEMIEGVLAAGLLLTLWGLSWCGINRFPAALFRLWKLHGTQANTCFYSNRMEDTGSVFRMEYHYQSVRDVYEGKRAFFLVMEDKRFLILQKNCFVFGDPGAFRRFMDEQCGKPVNKL